jgi:hypothetical protein
MRQLKVDSTSKVDSTPKVDRDSASQCNGDLESLLRRSVIFKDFPIEIDTDSLSIIPQFCGKFYIFPQTKINDELLNDLSIIIDGTIVLSGNVSIDEISKIPQNFKKVEINETTTRSVVENISHIPSIEAIVLNDNISTEVIKAIPQRIKYIEISSGITDPKTVAALLQLQSQLQSSSSGVSTAAVSKKRAISEVATIGSNSQEEDPISKKPRVKM